MIDREPCPSCGSERSLAGPYYDRSAFSCQECGHRWRETDPTMPAESPPAPEPEREEPPTEPPAALSRVHEIREQLERRRQHDLETIALLEQIAGDE